jgi:hypothetical protein
MHSYSIIEQKLFAYFIIFPNVLYFSCMLHACYLLFIMCLCMSVKSSTELMLYVVLTMPTLNKAYLFIYLNKAYL